MAETSRETMLIVGAGLTGAVLARALAERGFNCVVQEERAHVGGHCHTERDPRTGILVHREGPHTLHSDDEEVWAFVERFCEIYPYRHIKRATAGGESYPMPINLQTLSQFFDTTMGPDEARARVAAEAAPHVEALDGRPPANFEEAGLATIGRALYTAFYQGYTVKQWGVAPKDLPAAIFSRVPIRFDNSWNYFHHARQGQPVGGYTALVERILDHKNIALETGRPYVRGQVSEPYAHTFYTGPLDRYFDWAHGRLPYRTLRFDDVYRDGDFQGCAVVNCCEQDLPYTRITEHKHFSAGWEQHDQTVVSYEYASDCGPDDTPFYPLRLAASRRILADYVEAAKRLTGVSFLGRLGTYRYIDMDVAIREALDAAERVAASRVRQEKIPSFFVEPLKK